MGNLLIDDDEVREKFWTRVDSPSETACWEWQGAKSSRGYGRFLFEGRSVAAHRFAYVDFHNEEVDDALSMDHLCRNPGCVNPDHLEPVPQRENVLRGVGTPAVNARRTHCPKGHEYTPENTLVRAEGWRVCRACHRRQKNQARTRRRAAIREQAALKDDPDA